MVEGGNGHVMLFTPDEFQLHAIIYLRDWMNKSSIILNGYQVVAACVIAAGDDARATNELIRSQASPPQKRAAPG